MSNKNNIKYQILNIKYFKSIVKCQLLIVALLSLITFHFSLLTPLALAQNFPKQDVLDVNLNYKDGQVTLTSVDKRQGYIPDYLNQPTEGYTLTVFDGQSAQLFSVKFNFPLQIHTDDFSDPQNPKGEVQTLTEADTTITVPVQVEARKVQVAEPDGSIVASHDLSIIVDPKLAERGATKPGIPGLNLWPWLAGFGLILAILIANYLWTRKKLNP